jgi:hypothetical protein
MSVKSEFYDAGAADTAADGDMLILVDQSDNEVGHMSKSSCPRWSRHAASCFFHSDFQ